MRIELRNSGVPISDNLRRFIERKLSFALRRFADRVVRIIVRLTDLNGPKGGPDKRCRILAFLTASRRIVVEATDNDAYTAVSQAALRLDEQVARVVRRGRSKPASLFKSTLPFAAQSPAPERPDDPPQAPPPSAA